MTSIVRCPCPRCSSDQTWVEPRHAMPDAPHVRGPYPDEPDVRLAECRRCGPTSTSASRPRALCSPR
jgi:hypothetical protein